MDRLTAKFDVPAAASAGRRTAAWVVDFALLMVFAALVGGWVVHHITSLAADLPGVAADALDLISSRGDFAGAALDAGWAAWGRAVLVLHLALAVVVLADFGYQFALLRWRGRTVGKALLDVRVSSDPPAGADSELTTGQLAGRAALGAMTDFGLFAFACSALVNGHVNLALALWLLSVAVFWGNLVPAVFDDGRRTVNDLLTGTVVVRGDLYQAIAEAAAIHGQRARDAVSNTSQRAGRTRTDSTRGRPPLYEDDLL